MSDIQPPRTPPPAQDPASALPSTPDTRAKGPPQPHCTPAGRGRPALQNLYATKSHQISAQMITPRLKPDYLDVSPHKHKFKEEEMAVITGDAGISKALKVVGSFTPHHLEKNCYPPTVKLLNCLSLLFFKLAPRAKSDRAIIFAFTFNRAHPGSYLGEEFQPDYSAYEGSLAELEDAIATRPKLKPQSQLVFTGEHKRLSEPEMAQLKTYLSQNKRYRPDFPTVHGFHVTGSEVQLATLSACGMCVSPKYATSKLEPWLAIVTAAYDTVDTRIKTLTYNVSQLDWHRWDFTGYDRPPFAAVPFHVGEAPGRVTFALFEVASLPLSHEDMTKAFYKGPAQGFVKASWQDTTARWSESGLLAILHELKWLPGLVRPKFTMRKKDLIIKRLGDPTHEETLAAKAKAQKKGVEWMPEAPLERLREVIHLGSIGEPFSQARTLRHVVWAAYDLLETSCLMGEKGIMHRDLSWYNCLILPRHILPPGTKEEEFRPCIRRIMEKAGIAIPSTLSDIGVRVGSHTDDDAKYEPCALVTDLDHSAIIKELREGEKGGRRERTGTAMFIATEMAESGAVNHDELSIVLLAPALALVEESEVGKRCLNEAFPGDKGDFMKMVKRVTDKEQDRRTMARLQEKELPSQSDPVHELRHDVESLYWVLLWAFARARPLSDTLDNPEEPDGNKELDSFCKAMLFHRVGDRVKETERSRYLITEILNAQKFLHPKFAILQTQFSYMALYLSVPWHLYSDDPYIVENPTHAHIAFRRLLLHLLIRDDRPELDIELNTELPRITYAVAEETKEMTMASQQRAATGNEKSIAEALASQSASQIATTEDAPATAGSFEHAGYNLRGMGGSRRTEHTRVSAISIRSRSSNTSQKRARDPDDDGKNTSKKLRPEPASVPDEDQAMKDETEGDPVAETREEEAITADQQEQKYSAVLHANDQSVFALRLKFWKDKALWFGRGV